MIDTHQLRSLAAADLFSPLFIAGLWSIATNFAERGPERARAILVSMLISAKCLAPRAGFEPATNRLTAPLTTHN
jgi:hypothetical protein